MDGADHSLLLHQSVQGFLLPPISSSETRQIAPFRTATLNSHLGPKMRRRAKFGLPADQKPGSVRFGEFCYHLPDVLSGPPPSLQCGGHCRLLAAGSQGREKAPISGLSRVSMDPSNGSGFENFRLYW